MRDRDGDARWRGPGAGGRLRPWLAARCTALCTLARHDLDRARWQPVASRDAYNNCRLAQLARLARTVGSWLAAAILLAAAGTGLWRYTHAHPAISVRYETAPVDRGPIAAKVTASGTVSALVTVQVDSQVSGRIQARYADFNSPVGQGSAHRGLRRGWPTGTKALASSLL